MAHSIGTLNEHQLHNDLKHWLARPGDQIEQSVDGYHIDIVRDGLLIEIQTGSFSSIKRKLTILLEDHPVLLVYPVPQAKWIVKQNKRGKRLARRKSPKQGRVEHVFDELVRLPQLANHPNFHLQVLLTHQEEVWRDDGKGSWRRGKWSIANRHLLKVGDAARFDQPSDYLGLLPDVLPTPFTNKQLAKAAKLSPHLSGKMTYCLRQMGSLDLVGKEGNAYLFAPSNGHQTA